METHIVTTVFGSSCTYKYALQSSTSSGWHLFKETLTVSSPPPAMMASVPAFAPLSPPDTGASTDSHPLLFPHCHSFSLAF